MEERISKIERELAVMGKTQSTMSGSLKEISTTLKELLKLNTDTKLMSQKLDSHLLDTKNTNQRLFDRVEKVEDNQAKVAWLIIVSVIGALMSLILKG